jgi:predicted membrane-bound spermidine synthase
MDTLKNRLADILVLSLRPAQLMLCVSAFFMAVAIYFEHIARDAEYISFINPWLVVVIFTAYSVSSAYCCFVTSKSKYDLVLRNGSAGLGILLWSLSFVVEMLSHDFDTMVIHVMPICAEAWALAQLASRVRDLDRRAL